MIDINALKEQIHAAFADVEYPGDWCLRGSDEGEEPFLLEKEFAGKTSWQSLDHGFLNQAPDGFSSALSFFSDEAFRFYLPAYLIADIDGHLESVDPVFHLCFGLDKASATKPVNPRRYGHRTWSDEKHYQFSIFSPAQAAAIVAYLQHKLDLDSRQGDLIDQALSNCWLQAKKGFA